MKIFNTLSRKKEEFVPITPGKVKIYACGPTVYNYIHIGNARPMCVFDVLRRYLEYKGYEVKFVQNFTDVDDKIINLAVKNNVDFSSVAEKFIIEYKVDAKGLNIKAPTCAPKATENIDKMIEIISVLEKKGFAYQKSGDVFFRVSKYNGYGCLSHMPIKDLELGARIEVNSTKENPLDFVLWKAAKEGEPSWDSPWGKGRPGWHIECTAMINKIFGSTIDIHCGGKDLIFPHHENEIAQSVCYTDKKYVNYWMHNGYINVNNRKMSKSVGNFFTVRDVANKFGYPAIRFMMLQVHYRSPINYSLDVIQQCISALSRIKNCKDNLELAINNNSCKCLNLDNNDEYNFAKYKQLFIDAMDDDLNTADAISVIFELVTEINSNIINKDDVPESYLLAAKQVLDELTGVLGILYSVDDNKSKVDDYIKQLVALREKARKEKNFAEADRIRDEIRSRGFTLEDTPQGVVIK